MSCRTTRGQHTAPLTLAIHKHLSEKILPNKETSFHEWNKFEEGIVRGGNPQVASWHVSTVSIANVLRSTGALLADADLAQLGVRLRVGDELLDAHNRHVDLVLQFAQLAHVQQPQDLGRLGADVV